MAGTYKQVYFWCYYFAIYLLKKFLESSSILKKPSFVKTLSYIIQFARKILPMFFPNKYIQSSWEILWIPTFPRLQRIRQGSYIIYHNHLVPKRTLNHLAKWLASLTKWLSVRLRTKWLRIQIALLSLKLQIWCLLRARSSLTFRQTIECGFTLKLVRDV